MTRFLSFFIHYFWSFLMNGEQQQMAMCVTTSKYLASFLYGVFAFLMLNLMFCCYFSEFWLFNLFFFDFLKQRANMTLMLSLSLIACSFWILCRLTVQTKSSRQGCMFVSVRKATTENFFSFYRCLRCSDAEDDTWNRPVLLFENTVASDEHSIQNSDEMHRCFKLINCV